MDFKVEVIEEMSLDPNFKVHFFYKSKDGLVDKGYAEVLRRFPKSEIKYDSDTDIRLNKDDKEKLELEILNVVIDHLFSYGVLSSYRGKYLLRMA